MAITRTAKGTNSSKAATTSLSINNVEMDAGSTLIVGICFETSAGNPTSIKWGNKVLTRDITKEHSVAGIRTQIYRAQITDNKIRDIVATWNSTLGARAMFATQISELRDVDVSKDKAETNVGTPDTGVAVVSTVADTISIAAFGSNGPLFDTPGTAGSGHTLGQREGTEGGAVTSNVTIQETYEILSEITTIKSQMTGATARDWANCIVAYKE